MNKIKHLHEIWIILLFSSFLTAPIYAEMMNTEVFSFPNENTNIKVASNFEVSTPLSNNLSITAHKESNSNNANHGVFINKNQFAVTIVLMLFALVMMIYFISANRSLKKVKTKILREKERLEKDINTHSNNITLLHTISNAQSSYINTKNKIIAFDSLLDGLLELTKSFLGGIIDIKETAKAQDRYTPLSSLIRNTNTKNNECASIALNVYAIEPLCELFEIVYKNKETLLTSVDLSKTTLFLNEIPADIPKKNNIMIVPILNGDVITGIVFLWNTEITYDNKIIETLSPLFSTCESLISQVAEQKHVKAADLALRENEEQQSAIINSMSDALIVIDEQGKIQKINSAGENIFQYKASEIIGKPVNILMPNHYSEKHSHYINKRIESKIAIEGAVRTEISGRRKDMSEFPALLSISEMIINGNHYFTGVMRDITETKHIEQVAREKDAAELSNKTKTEFIANMSHEFRTPLHAILSFTQLGLRKIKKGDLDAIEKYLTHIESGGNRLIKLIDNILDLSSLEAGHTTLVYEDCNLEIIAKNVLSDLKSLTKEKNLQVKLIKSSGTFELSADPTRIHQVIINLISNAIKFSPENSAIQVELTYEKISVKGHIIDALKLSVLDEGIGIPEGEEKSIFHKFIQSSKTKTKAGGTGLGLAICKEFIKLHQGKIEGKNRTEGGAIISFTVPVHYTVTKTPD